MVICRNLPCQLHKGHEPEDGAACISSASGFLHPPPGPSVAADMRQKLARIAEECRFCLQSPAA